MTTITDTTKSPILIATGTTATPFTGVNVVDPISTTETLTIQLSSLYYGSNPSSFGTLSDPLGGGTYDPVSHSFTETALVTGSPTAATQILNRLVYTAPTLSNGSFQTINATVLVGNGVTAIADPTPIQLETVTPPALSGVVANEPVASGSTVRPFGAVDLADYNPSYGADDSVSITLTDGGTATDADGLLTGAGLGKTGVGTYTLGANYFYSLSSLLQGLVFTPTAVAPGATRTTGFELKVNDARTGLSTDDKTTSVLVIGPPSPGIVAAPLIAGTSGILTVAPGNAVQPFSGVTISDTNANPSDSATIAVGGSGGTLSGVGLIQTGTNTYSVAATSPTQLTAILDKLTFTPPAGLTTGTTAIALLATDAGQTATDTNTIIQVQSPTTGGITVIPPDNFTVADQTTGKQYNAHGQTYTGNVQGLAWELTQVTPDSLNVTANVPNAFIHTGSGNDAVDVSKVNGNNVLDGSTGSNFLTGGIGFDTFFLDDRGPTSDVFSTVVNFHSGDNITVFGVNATDFALTTLDNQGAANAKGLDYAFTAAGHPNANVVIAGYTAADQTNGRLVVTFGTTADVGDVKGSTYFNIHAN